MCLLCLSVCLLSMLQFCGDNPETLLQAARYVEPYVDAVDLNLGCPQVL